MMLLAPKTLWAMVNLYGSVGGKYGAKTHFSTHLRRRILQAAQGLRTIGGGGDGGAARLGEDCEGDANLGEDCEVEGKLGEDNCWGEGKVGEDWEGGEEENEGEGNGVVICIFGIGFAIIWSLQSIFWEK